MSSLVLLTKAWSSEIVSTQPVPENLSGVEAIVVKIEQESLTLKPTNSESAEISIPRRDDGTFAVGDKVVLHDQNLRKVGEFSSDLTPTAEKELKDAGTGPKSP